MGRVAFWVMTTAVAVLLTGGLVQAAVRDGTSGPDTLTGTDQADEIRGRGDAGDDTIDGGRGGTPDQPERLDGDAGDDTVSGGGGADEIRGGVGDDTLSGDGGDDEINASDDGLDQIFGGAGDDVIDAEDGLGVDTVDCGDGVDSVRFDEGVDVVAANCENPDPR